MFTKNKQYWPDNTVYFLTGSTFLHYPYFNDDDKKMILLNQFKKIQEVLNIPISAYSIAVNHYHLKFYLEQGSDIKKVKQILHGGSSYLYRQKYQTDHKEIWQSSKLLRVFSQKIDRRIAGYIAGNLLKHKEVSTFDELYSNKFSCYRQIVDKDGLNYANRLVREVIDIKESEEGDIFLGDFN
jgi:REP element-mobilizing transposase RayT